MVRGSESFVRCAVECVKTCVDREAKEVMNSDVLVASEELLRRAEVCEKGCIELCERAGANFVSNQQYMDSFASATLCALARAYLRASARAYKQGLIALGIFMAALGAVLFTIGFVLGTPWLMVFSLPLLLIGITQSLVEIITNKNKDGGGNDAEA